ncbi:protein sprint isoform X3 [Tribolium castaneum]|uniref:protein sprint isoform X3 n=1 Tax=Tribolium castaneum TaxID=7070 RepID=UPI00046C2C25|nr:PREDICTED: protein sprint isoform X3 [Tribolium castaneum]XP_008191542.1 PREDICTED: protein sprint isoform X3 [Tribolium castaneum]|eukprot:XP_008191541.1 PREDICTED: protein sprint isoform X3 [Tribolium castaneum]
MSSVLLTCSPIMLPESLDNGLRSPNNNTGLPRTRGSLCLSPVTAVVDNNKRKSWCGGTPTSQFAASSRRYGELGHFKPRSDAFLEPYLLGDRQSPGMGAPTPSPPIPDTPPSPPTRSASGESLLSSNGGSEGGSEDSGSGYGATCDIGLTERLIRSHPIWFLPGIQRAGAFHLLQGKEEGCFVVRQSSQSDTMALSVRLPPDKGPYIEHYLIQSSEGHLGLETSENRFGSMPELIAHYANCCDELPVQLTLPKAIREAKSRQQLSSLALLGQEFWRYSPPPSVASSPDIDLNLMSTFKSAETKPTRPNTLNLMSFIEPLKAKNETKTPPPPPPRWSKPSTPQNNFTVTTTVTFSVNSSPSEPIEVARMSPEGQCNSTLSSKGSLILSPNSDTILSPDTLSPLSASKTTRSSKRSKHKLSKHYQESDIVDSPTFYYRSGLGDKISDYEDVWTNNDGSKGKGLASPDILQHTNTNNNVLSPVECTTAKNPVIEDLAQTPKQGSPFYAEPADSIANPVPRRCLAKTMVPMNQRHSNPPGLLAHSPLSPGLERIDSDFNVMSSSADNLSPKQRFPGLRKPEVKPVQPPLIKTRVNDSWQIDNGWTFRSSECETTMESSDYDSDWPVINTLISSIHPYTPDPDDGTTVQDMISKRFPDIPTSTEELCRMSAYDNVEDRRVPRAPPSEISELTEFSDPWTELSQVANTETDDSINNRRSTKVASINRSKSFKDRLDPLLSAPRLQALRNREQSGPKAVGAAIRTYALELAQDKNTTFAQNIDNFIACTCESKETNPQIIMRNMRQFMSGMKNYLVKHGEKGFYKEIERERSKLKSTEFLNLDAILEGVMHKLVVKPLKGHLQKLFLDHYTKTGAIRLLADNIQFAATRPIAELAIKPKITLPSESSLATISQYLQRLQSADSPLEKLEYLLAAIATIFNSVKTGQLTGSGKSVQLGADDFLPLFVWVLVKTNFVAAEIEAEYMWGLLHPSLLSGEGGYYLTTLSSAVHVLKNFKESCVENVKSNVKNDVRLIENIGNELMFDFQSVLKVVVPDELHGSILTKTLPAKPHMTTKDVCNIIAHKARITNPQDYALYRVTDGEETMLLDNECPQDFISGSKHTMLAYKRTDAKIAWPNQDKLSL